MKKISLILLLLILFATRYKQSLPMYEVGDTISINSVIRSEPVNYEKAQYIRINNLKIYLPHYPKVNYGDQITLIGEVGENNVVKNIREVEVTQTDNKLYRFRNRLISIYKTSLPLPHSSLVAGMALGSKGLIPSYFWEQLKTTGTAHVVVASGTNVMLVGGFIVAAGVHFVNRRKLILITLITIWIYALMAGFDAPIIRAAIMGSLAFTSQALGRVYASLRGLGIAAVGMLLVNPLWIHDSGFQLSVAASASLIYFQPWVNSKIPPIIPHIFREGLTTSLAAQIGVAPIMYLTFGQLSLISPIVNALVLWTTPFITIIGLTGSILGHFVPVIGRLILLTSYPFTTYFVWIINIFS